MYSSLHSKIDSSASSSKSRSALGFSACPHHIPYQIMLCWNIQIRSDESDGVNRTDEEGKEKRKVEAMDTVKKCKDIGARMSQPISA